MATSDTSKKEAARPASSGKSTPAQKSGSTRPSSPRVVDDDEPTVIGGRFLIAALILGALTVIPMSKLGDFFEPADPPGTDVSAWQVGQKSKLVLTVVTADAAALTCASPQSFEGKHCQFKTQSEPWPREPGAPVDDNKANTIQPYRTWLDNKLILVSGVWASPSLAMRVHNEPPGNLSPDKLARFTAECKVHFAGKMDKPELRWAPGQGWGTEQATMVAVADECNVIPEPSRDCPEGPICALMHLFSKPIP